MLGSVRDSQTRSLVTHNDTGWLFDSRADHEMIAALDAAMNTPQARLDTMRKAARARFRKAHGDLSSGITDRLWRERFARPLADNASA